MSTHKTTDKSAHPSTPKAAPALKIVENTTDATRGEPLAMRAAKRKAELVTARAKLSPEALRDLSDIDLALGAVDELLTGDPEHLGDATAAGLNRWLENTKHLAEVTPKSHKQMH